MLRPDLMRQFDIIKPELLDQKITIIGAGAVGGWTALFLAKMGFRNFDIFDFDKVEIENVGSQIYRPEDIGRMKASSLAHIINKFIVDIPDQTAPIMQFRIKKYIGEEVLSGIIICAVDNMVTRSLVWKKHKNNKQDCMIIDPRMAAEFATIYCMNPTKQEDIISYEKTLFEDSEGVQEPCTGKSTMYTAGIMAGLICKIVKDIVTKNPYSRVTNFNIAANSMETFNAR